MNLMEGGLNCARPAIYGMSVQNSGPHFLHLSLGAFASLTPGSKFTNATKKLTLSFDNTQGLYHEYGNLRIFYGESIFQGYFSIVLIGPQDLGAARWVDSPSTRCLVLPSMGGA
jgi:hypothetical protein